MRYEVLSGALLAILLSGCAAAPTAPLRATLGENARGRRVVGWRLVERTYGSSDAGHGGDGEIPAGEAALVYQPVFEDVPGPIRECGAVRLRSSCDHDVAVTIRGGGHFAVGTSVTAEGRITAPRGLYHEFAIEPQSSSIEILEVRGGLPVSGKPGRFFLEGTRSFEVDFTSRSAGKSGIAISVLRELGRDAARSESRYVVDGPRPRSRVDE